MANLYNLETRAKNKMQILTQSTEGLSRASWETASLPGLEIALFLITWPCSWQWGQLSSSLGSLFPPLQTFYPTGCICKAHQYILDDPMQPLHKLLPFGKRYQSIQVLMSGQFLPFRSLKTQILDCPPAQICAHTHTHASLWGPSVDNY